METLLKKEVITTGKTIDEAVAVAVSELGAPSAESIEYTVLEEPKKGLFGIGAAPAKISASYTLSGADIALEFVKSVINDMGLDAQAVMTQGDNDDTLINIDGEGSGVLIGHHGETLDSLQYLANLAANKKSDETDERNYTRILVDIENYREKRAETLKALARRMAGRVLKYKRNVTLEPMSAYERRIIHSEIQGIEGVTTYSVGAEGNRKVVIQLED